MLKGTGADAGQGQATAVVVQADAQAAHVELHLDVDPPGGRLASGQALGRRLQAVVHRVAQQVGEQVLEQRGDLVLHHHMMVVQTDHRWLLAQLACQGWQRVNLPCQHALQAFGADLAQGQLDLLECAPQGSGIIEVHRGQQVQRIGQVLTVHQRVLLNTATAARPLAAQHVVVDAGVLFHHRLDAVQRAQQLRRIPDRVGILAQLVVGLLGFVNEVGEVDEGVGAGIALDGVHVAEQQRHHLQVLVRRLLDELSVLNNEAA